MKHRLCDDGSARILVNRGHANSWSLFCVEQPDPPSRVKRFPPSDKGPWGTSERIAGGVTRWGPPSQINDNGGGASDRIVHRSRTAPALGPRRDHGRF